MLQWKTKTLSKEQNYMTKNSFMYSIHQIESFFNLMYFALITSYVTKVKITKRETYTFKTSFMYIIHQPEDFCQIRSLFTTDVA